MRKVITLEQALAGKPIADPLTLYDCSLISDGAAAVILAPLERASEFTDKPVRILGVAQASDFVALDQKLDITTFPALRIAAQKAYSMAGVSAADIEFAELHDCFTIAEIVAMEDLGFVERGQGGFASAAGETRRTGRIPDQRQRRLEIERPPRRRHRRRANLRCRPATSLRSRPTPTRPPLARSRPESGRLRGHLCRFHPGPQLMTVYTETVVHLAPPAFQADVPYQVAIVTLDDNTRVTGRIEGLRVQIGDPVTRLPDRDGVPYFRESMKLAQRIGTAAHRIRL